MPFTDLTISAIHLFVEVVKLSPKRRRDHAIGALTSRLPNEMPSKPARHERVPIARSRQQPEMKIESGDIDSDSDEAADGHFEKLQPLSAERKHGASERDYGNHGRRDEGGPLCRNRTAATDGGRDEIGGARPRALRRLPQEEGEEERRLDVEDELRVYEDEARLDEEERVGEREGCGDEGGEGREVEGAAGEVERRGDEGAKGGGHHALRHVHYVAEELADCIEFVADGRLVAAQARGEVEDELAYGRVDVEEVLAARILVDKLAEVELVELRRRRRRLSEREGKKKKRRGRPLRETYHDPRRLGDAIEARHGGREENESNEQVLFLRQAQGLRERLGVRLILLLASMLGLSGGGYVRVRYHFRFRKLAGASCGTTTGAHR